ncbi:MAG: hypothetical protein Q9176_001882 [Flavoplaca citrina]
MTDKPKPTSTLENLARLAAKPGVQSTLVLSASDGSIIKSTGLLAETALSSSPDTSLAREDSNQDDKSLSTSLPSNSINRYEGVEGRTKSAEHVAKMVFNFVAAAKDFVEGIEKGDDAKLLRLRTRKQEIVIFPAFGAASVCVKYEVLNCCDQFPLVAQAIKSFTAALSPIILDVKKSAVNPSEAYKAFFKDPASTPFIEQVLTDAKTGVPKRPPVQGTSEGSPTFLCINKPGVVSFGTDGKTVDAFDICNDPEAGIIARYNSPTPFIFLCPIFFKTLRPAPRPGTADCPVLSRRFKRFRRGPYDYPQIIGSGVINNFWWVLLEEIVHYYLHAYKDDVFSLQPEVYDINKAWELSSTDSLANAARPTTHQVSIHICHL